MYELRFHPKVDKELSKLSADVRRLIRDEHLPAISVDPHKNSKSLKGSLKDFLRKDFHCGGISHRIAYEIDEKQKVVYILMIGKRDNFYDRLNRRVNI